MAYLVIITFEMLLLKKVVSDVKLSPWGLVMYNNMLAFLVSPIGALGLANFPVCKEAVGSLTSGRVAGIMALLISCAFGLSISYFGMSTRSAFSATTFTVIGVANKFACAGNGHGLLTGFWILPEPFRCRGHF